MSSETRIEAEQRGPVIHFAVRSDAEERVHMGPALCKAGMAHRNENEQYVAGNWEFVTCKTCHRLLAAHNKREEAEAMSWWVVICRLCGDDEDSCYIVQAENWQRATRLAEAQMRDERGEPFLNDEDEVEETDEETRPVCYVNYAINCGDTKPIIEMSNP